MKVILLTIVVIALQITSCSTNKSIEQNNSKISQLNSELSESNQLNAQLKDSIVRLNEKSDRFKNAADLCYVALENAKESRELNARRFNALSQCLYEQGDTLQQIKRDAVKALSMFDKSNIEVKYHNGMVFISLQDEFMFPSGSTGINPGGKKALAVVAGILLKYQNVTAIVVGNTDTIDTHKGYRDNWSLSTERANTVVRHLLSEYSINPVRLVSAGRSKFYPVASNSGKKGRAQNRRIDIVINPDLNELWILSQKYP
jgi:chemotaxis protein MotB